MRSLIRLIQCTIERGGFSSERCFTLVDAEGKDIVGMADISHLCNSEMQPLPDGEPPIGEKMSGLVKCRILRSGADENTVLIDLPGNEVAIVDAEKLIETNAAMQC